jgi:Clr5 domain
VNKDPSSPPISPSSTAGSSTTFPIPQPHLFALISGLSFPSASRCWPCQVPRTDEMSHHHRYNHLDACSGARKSHSAKEWLARKPRIAYLYCKQDLTLQQVMELMRQEANFDATVKMYKSHITLWGLRKNNQLREAQAILRKKYALESAGFHPLFLIRGQLADMNDIERCCKRAKAEFSTTDADAEDHSLPESVEYLGFQYHLNLIDAPAKFTELQRFLHNTLVHFDSCFDRGLWRSESDDQDLAYPQDMELLAKQCFDDLSYATACFENGHSRLGQVFAQRAFDNFSAVLQTNHQDVISALLVQLDRIQRKGLDVFLLDAVSRFAKLASTDLPLAHPHAALFNALETLAYDSIGSLYQVHIAQRRSLYIRNVGRDHYRVVRTETLPSLSEDVNLTPLTHIQEAVALADTRYGPTSRRSLLILASYCCRIYRTDRSMESEVLFSELVQRAEQTGPCQTRVSARYRLGKLQRDQGKNQEARRHGLRRLKLPRKILRSSNTGVRSCSMLWPSFAMCLSARKKRRLIRHRCWNSTRLLSMEVSKGMCR